MLYSVFMLALRSVQRNMLRSFLTILGIVIGVMIAAASSGLSLYMAVPYV